MTGALCQLSRGGAGYSCLLTSPGYFMQRCGIALWNRLGRLTVSTDNELFLASLFSGTGGWEGLDPRLTVLKMSLSPDCLGCCI